MTKPASHTGSTIERLDRSGRDDTGRSRSTPTLYDLWPPQVTPAYISALSCEAKAKGLSRLCGDEFGEVGFLERDQSARELQQREMVLVLL